MRTFDDIDPYIVSTINHLAATAEAAHNYIVSSPEFEKQRAQNMLDLHIGIMSLTAYICSQSGDPKAIEAYSKMFADMLNNGATWAQTKKLMSSFTRTN